MHIHEGFQVRGDMHASERGGRRHLQRALHLRRASGNVVFGLLDAGENAKHAIVEALACLRQGDLPRRALQEPRAEPIFKPFYPLRHDRRRKAESPAGKRHAPRRNDLCENFEITEIGHSLDCLSFWNKCLAFAP